MQGHCYFCGIPEPTETHHIVPRRFNGSDRPDNLVEVCANCHRKLEALYDARFYSELGVSQDDFEEGVPENHRASQHEIGEHIRAFLEEGERATMDELQVELDYENDRIESVLKHLWDRGEVYQEEAGIFVVP